jgi:putative tricarboxylic transport membrane protein
MWMDGSRQRMRRFSKRRFGLGLTGIAALIGLVAACGGDDDGGGAESPVEPGESDAAEVSFEPGSTECVAPADPGGGWDLTCRSGGQVLQEAGIINGPMQVTNMPGAGGGVGFAHVVAQRNEDDNLVVAASPATTLRLAQGQYGAFDASAVRWLGAIAKDVGVVAVPEDSPYQSLQDLVDAWTESPSDIAIGGGSAVGGQDNMKVLILAQAVGVPVEDVKYVPFDGGGEAMTAMLGGTIDVFPGDVSEILGQLEAGDIRVLATLSDEPVPALPDVPTAQELGFDVEWTVWRGFYGPGGMSDEAYEFWTDALEQVEASDEWRQIRDDSGLLPFLSLGDEFTSLIEQEVADFTELSESIGIAAGG